jgi:NTE family protein
VAFVLGGGGILGASEVGMLAALLDRGVHPDLIVGTSVGAINGAALAADPTPAAVERLTDLWSALGASEVFAGGPAKQLATVVQHGHLHSNAPLRRLLHAHLPDGDIEDLPVRFQCVAASVERATARWFDRGPLLDAVLASCAVPALLPPVKIGDEHYVDGGIVDSTPVGRAVALGARTVFVLHVGRIERPLRPPRWPWEAGLVAFEIARRRGFADAMASLPDGVAVHVLPTGDPGTPFVPLRYRSAATARRRIDRAHAASLEHLATLPALPMLPALPALPVVGGRRGVDGGAGADGSAGSGGVNRSGGPGDPADPGDPGDPTGSAGVAGRTLASGP